MGTTAADAHGGALRVLTFSGSQPFVVRCERETRVKDIVAAIAEIWGFKEACHLFTLCRPPPGVTDALDASKLLPGCLMAWNDRPCQVAAAASSDKQPGDAAAAAGGAAAAAAAQPPAQAPLPPLLLVRALFGGGAQDAEKNQAVLSLTAAQIAADLAAGRYPVSVDASLCQQLVNQGQHAVVLHMASSWPSGACLVVGPAQVLSGGAGFGLAEEQVNLGINAQGIHLMTRERHRAHLSVDAIRSATPAGDVLNIRFATGQPDLLLQLPGAEAVAEAFRLHKEAAEQRSGARQQQLQQQQAPSHPLTPGLQPAAASAAAEARPVAAAIRVLRPWEQSPPLVRASLQVVYEEPQLLEAQLLVVDEGGDGDGGGGQVEEGAAQGGDAGPDTARNGSAAAAGAPAARAAPQQRIKLRLRVLSEGGEGPVPRVKLAIAHVSEEEQQRLQHPPGEAPLVRLDLRVAAPPAAAHDAGGGPGAAAGGMTAPGSNALLPGVGVGSCGHPAQLLQRLQQKQQQQAEVRQGLLAAGMQAGSFAGLGFGGPHDSTMRPMYGGRGVGGFRPAMQHQGMAAWAAGQGQYGAGGSVMGPRGPATMRPLGSAGGVAYQPYSLVGPPGGMMAGPQQAGAYRAGGVMGSQVMHARPQQQRMQLQLQQQQYQAQVGHMPQQRGMLQQQQQYAYQQQQVRSQQAMIAPHMHAGAQQLQQPVQQQQLLVQQPGGGYVLLQQPHQQLQLQQPQAMQQQAYAQQQQPVAYTAMQMAPQHQQQQVLMVPANAVGGQQPQQQQQQQPAGGGMVLVTTADGRQMLMGEGQLQQLQLQQQQQQQLAQQQHYQQQQQQPMQQQAMPQQQQPQVMPGVFVLGPHGQLVPASQPQVAAEPMQQQLMLQQPQQQQQGQQVLYMQAQQQQQQPAAQKPQPQAHMFQPLDQLGAMGLSQPQQAQVLQPQALGLMDLHTGQQQQQQYVAMSSALTQSGQMLQLQQPAAPGYQQQLQGMVLQGQQQQQPGAQQLFMAAGGQPQQPQQQQQQQQGMVLLDGGGLSLQQHRRMSGGAVATSGAMFGAGGPLMADSGPSSTGGGSGLGFLQQQGGLQGLGLADAAAAGGLMAGGGYGATNSHGSSLDAAGAGLAPDPPGLNFGAGTPKVAGFMQQQAPQQQAPQHQALTLGGGGGMAGLPPLALQGDGLALQGGVASSDGYDGLGGLGGVGGLPGSSGFITQPPNQTSYF